jgi:hypothetical protein
MVVGIGNRFLTRVCHKTVTTSAKPSHAVTAP